MLIAGSRYQHNSFARKLREVAKFRLKVRREIVKDPAFREKLRERESQEIVM